MKRALIGLALTIFALVWLAWAALNPRFDILARGLAVPDTPHDADVIVVASAGLLNDCEADNNLFTREFFGSELLKKGFSRSGKIILTGQYSVPSKVSSRACFRRLADRFGIPTNALILENKAVNTYENALYTRYIMDQYGWKDALLVTSFSHAKRARWTFEHAGITVYSTHVPDHPPLYDKDWKNPGRLAHLQRFIYEYVALLKYKWYGYL